MRYWIDNHDNPDPFVNMALEEHCIRSMDGRHEYFLLYANEPSVIVGRNQNILQEVDHRFIKAHRIHLVRRLSGGGAVYHDRGNLNFSFIQKPGTGGLNNIRSFLSPVLRALDRMGIGAHINDRNDLMVGKKKISGSALFSNTRRIMVHGTLLFDSDLQALVRALTPPVSRLQTKAIQSVHRPVANIRSLLNRTVDLDHFKKRLLALLIKEIGEVQKLSLDDRHWKRIYRIAAQKYRSWDWTFGRTPDFSVMENGHGQYRLRIDVHRGKIAAIVDLNSDNGNGKWREPGKQLTGTRYERDEIRKALDGLHIAPGNRFPGAEPLADELCFN